MSEEAVVARKGPFGVVVEEGKTYWWCACGLSKSQPFCAVHIKVLSSNQSSLLRRRK